MSRINKLGIYRCNHCKTWGEAILGGQTVCEKCTAVVVPYEPLWVVEKLSARHMALLREIDSLKSQLGESESTEPTIVSDILLNNNQLATEKQHKPLLNWFHKRNVVAEFDYSAVDMSGFYDEAANQIGEKYAIFEKILRQLSWSYRKSVMTLNVDLKKYSQKEHQEINRLLREFYSHTLFAEYRYLKQDKIVKIKLQTAVPIRQFFMGEWLEWFALNEIVQTVQREKNILFSVARGAKIRFQNGDLHELDVLLYTSKNSQPVVIECKTGEYRRDLNKYLNLRKKLNIAATNFILLVLDIDEVKAKSLSSMYGLTFVTLETLKEHIEKVV